MALNQPESNALLSKVIQHFFSVANDQIKSGGRVIVMEAKENPRHEISRHSGAGRQSQSPIHFPGPIQLPQNLFEFGKDVLNSFPKMGASLG
jgi:hypothetical protein